MPKTQIGTVRLIRICQRKSVPCKLALPPSYKGSSSPKIPAGVLGGLGRELIEGGGTTEGQLTRELVIGRQAGKSR